MLEVVEGEGWIVSYYLEGINQFDILEEVGNILF